MRGGTQASPFVQGTAQGVCQWYRLSARAPRSITLPQWPPIVCNQLPAVTDHGHGRDPHLHTSHNAHPGRAAPPPPPPPPTTAQKPPATRHLRHPAPPQTPVHPPSPTPVTRAEASLSTPVASARSSIAE